MCKFSKASMIYILIALLVVGLIPAGQYAGEGLGAKNIRSYAGAEASVGGLGGGAPGEGVDGDGRSEAEAGSGSGGPLPQKTNNGTNRLGGVAIGVWGAVNCA